MRIPAFLFGVLAALAPMAAHATSTETAGTDLAILMPFAAAGISLYKDDGVGVEQLGLDTASTMATAELLKHFVKEQRPDKSDFQSFPSDTAALAFAPAQFLWDRYGWEYGVPAYLAAGFVGWSRVDAKKHHWGDVAASAAISFGFSQIFTTHFREQGFGYSASLSPSGAYASVSYKF